MGRYTALLKWHFADPASEAERVRNDAVAAYQGNRNPLIDHPEWVAAAFMPQVAIYRTDGTVTFYWSNDYAPGLVSEQSTVLSSGWLPVAAVATLTATNTWAISLPLEAGARFYRLRLE